MNDEYAVDGYNTAGTVTEGGLPFSQMGTSFVIGLALGYFLKKSFKILFFEQHSFDEAKKIITNEMENIIKNTPVKLTVDIGIGKSWFEAH